MDDEFKQLIANQFEAAFCTLNACIQQCPRTSWNAPVANLAFCQVAFHTLLFADLYLGSDEHALRQQPFHKDNAEFFRDYEELEDRPQRLFYDQPAIISYLQHCRRKAVEIVNRETVEMWRLPCGFPRKSFSRGELHVNNIRHIQHHAAQLSLRLRIDADIGVPWFASGWSDA